MIQAPPVSAVERRGTAGGTPRKLVTRPRLLLRFAGTVSLIQGIALAAIVVWDGSALWRIARVIGVLVTTAVVVWGQRPERSGSASLVTSLAWGAVGVAVGVGIGVVHVVKAGPSVFAALALVCLLTGLAATGRAFVGLIALLKGWRRLIAVPAAAVALIFVYYPLSVALLATNTPRVDIGAALPTDQGLAFEDVTFPTPDGIELSGWFMPGTNGAAVVLLHGGGGGSNRTAVLAHAEVLVNHGYSVLAFDARGHGRSGGEGMDWGWYGDLDITGALHFLESRDGVDPSRIAAVGLSMGGEEAITAAASDLRIKAVVAEGATNRVLADDDAFLPTHPGRWVNIAADLIKYGVADWISGARPPMGLTSAVMAIAPRPVLLISAGTVADEGRAAVNYEAAAPDSVQVWNVGGAGHTSGLATAPSEWEYRVVGFLDRAIGN